MTDRAEPASGGFRRFSKEKIVSIRLGIKKFDITPDRPVQLLGYFNERISENVLDPLYCRMAALEGEKGRLLFIQLDTCLILAEDVDHIKSLIETSGVYRKREILVFTNHTHTAPALANFFETRREPHYVDWLIGRITAEAETLQPEKRCTVKTALRSYTGLSYNRRWYMDDGSVATNPPKRSPRMIKPEGPVDRSVQVLMFQSGERIPDALFVNISNHTDTIGGNAISADWTGFMESYIQDELGVEVTVIPLIAPQGNINHFEFHSDRNQTSYREAHLLGVAYGREVIKTLPFCTHIPAATLSAQGESIRISPREVTGPQIKRAKALINGLPQKDDGRDLTAEDIVKENRVVEKLFAKELMQFMTHSPSEYHVPLQIVHIGDVAFCTIPGEPFVEIGLHLKSVSGPRAVFPVALANGYFGYIPLRECFDRGGYEIRATDHNCLSRKAAEQIIDWHEKALQRG